MCKTQQRHTGEKVQMGAKRKLFAAKKEKKMDVLGAPLSSFRPWKKLENQEIAFFDTYSEFPQTLIQKLFECFTFCCCSEYYIYTLSLETLTPDQVKNDITYNLSLKQNKNIFACLFLICISCFCKTSFLFMKMGQT